MPKQLLRQIYNAGFKFVKYNGKPVTENHIRDAFSYASERGLFGSYYRLNRDKIRISNELTRLMKGANEKGESQTAIQKARIRDIQSRMKNLREGVAVDPTERLRETRLQLRMGEKRYKRAKMTEIIDNIKDDAEHDNQSNAPIQGAPGPSMMRDLY